MSDINKEYGEEVASFKPKKLELNLDEISIEMDSNRWENEVYFDTETGELIYVPEELNQDNIYEDEYIAKLPDWEKEMVADIKAVYEDTEGRFISIPERGSREAYQLMVDFTKRLDDLDIAERLFDALDGKGAFRRFKRVISRYPETEEQWYKFKDESEKQEVREWLRSIGIEPVEKKWSSE